MQAGLCVSQRRERANQHIQRALSNAGKCKWIPIFISSEAGTTDRLKFGLKEEKSSFLPCITRELKAAHIVSKMGSVALSVFHSFSGC